MNWRLDFSNRSLKFIQQNNLDFDFIVGRVGSALKKFQGENVNVDIKKLGGDWKGFYRIRSGKLRIIIEFDFEKSVAYIDAIDWRGSVYR